MTRTAAVALIGLCLPTAALAGERCGPNRCGDGQTCCNASCGICTDPGGACILPDCGWDRRRAGGDLLLFPARAAQPTSATEADLLVDGGKAGDWTVLRTRLDLRAALSQDLVLTADADVDDRSADPFGLRRERLGASVVWAVPTGLRVAHVGVEVGGQVGRGQVTVSDSLFGSVSVRGDWQGRLVLGGSAALKIPAGVVTAGLRTLIQPGDEVLLGWQGHAAWSFTGWNDPAPAVLAGLVVDHQPGGPTDITVPIGVYAVFADTVQAGVEVAPVFFGADDKAQTGALIGLRVNVFGEPHLGRDR